MGRHRMGSRGSKMGTSRPLLVGVNGATTFGGPYIGRRRALRALPGVGGGPRRILGGRNPNGARVRGSLTTAFWSVAVKGMWCDGLLGTAVVVTMTPTTPVEEVVAPSTGRGFSSPMVEMRGWLGKNDSG